MWWWLLLLLIPALILAIVYLPVKVVATYDEKGAFAWLYLGPLRSQLYPRVEKKKKGKTLLQQIAEVPLPESPGGVKKEKGGPAQVFFTFVKNVLSLLNNVRKRLVIKRLDLKIVLAGGDPCELALNYGKSWAALGNLWPRLERWFDIRKRNVEVECDFEGSETLVTAYIHLSMPLYKVIYLLWQYLTVVSMNSEELKTTNKGGA